MQEWFYSKDKRPRASLLLVWDWQHWASLSETGCIKSVDPVTSTQNLDIALSRRLLVKRILDDVWHHSSGLLGRYLDTRLTGTTLPESRMHSQIKAIIRYDTQNSSYEWLQTYLTNIRYCISLINRKLKLAQPGPEAMISRWAQESQFEYGILCVIDLERSVKTTLRSNLTRSPTQDVDYLRCHSPMYWEFGERNYAATLEDFFPSYRQAMLASREQNDEDVPYSGRFLMRLLLTQENIDASLAQSPVAHFLTDPAYLKEGSGRHVLCL